MKVTHPVAGFSGYAQVGAYGLHFLAGEAHDTNIPTTARRAMEEDGFEFSDDRPGRGTEQGDNTEPSE